MQVRKEINGYFLTSLYPTASACLICASKRNHNTSPKALIPTPMPKNCPFGREVCFILFSQKMDEGWDALSITAFL